MKAVIQKEVEKILLEDYEKFYKAAFSYVRNENDALDIVQETAYKAIKECSKIKQKEYISTWIYRIVINTALDFLRKANREAELVKNSMIEIGGSFEEKYQDFEIMEILGMLEEKDRTLLVMRYFEDYKLEQIAQVTGEALSTVKSRLYRALKKLKLELEPQKVI